MSLRLVAVIVPSLAVHLTLASGISVSERVTLRTSGTLQTATTAATSEPDLPAPLFHFDSRQTENWTWYNDSKTRVTKIPSLSGTRYLKGGDGTSGKNGIDGGCWSCGDTVHRAPAYALDADLGECVVDFGKYGDGSTFYGMLFDPVDFSAAQDGSALTNILEGIGTVVAVWHSPSDAKGGDILGGGMMGTHSSFIKHVWARKDPIMDARHAYAAPTIDSRAAAGKAAVRQDGQWTICSRNGLKGGWQVLAIQPSQAILNASGLGVGDGRWKSGGFKVAEMYIFGTILPEEKVQALEAWLHRKWFGNSLPGFNGNAIIGEIRATSNANNHVAARVTLDVAAGDTLSVDSLRGGHGGNGAYVKTGAGSLAIGDMSTYDGELVLEEGEWLATRRTVPAFADLPRGCLVHFDASLAACVTTVDEDGVSYVTCLSNLVEGVTYNGSPIFARPYANNADYRPWVLKDELGTGRHVFDFGPFTHGGKRTPTDGRILRFAKTAEGTFASDAWELPICTAIAVIGAQRGGGHLLGYSGAGPNPFSRTDDAWMSDSSWIDAGLAMDKNDSDTGLNFQSNTRVFINGIARNPAKGYLTPGYQVVAIQTPGSYASMLGGFQNERAGGMRIAEIMLYGRILSDREVKDVQAYLAKKWFGRNTPGYGDAPAGRPDVHTLNAAGMASVTVDGTTGVRVHKFTGSGTLKKKGPGTLEIEEASATGTIKIEEGSVRIATSAGVETNCELAPGACLHLDASDLTTLEAPYKSNITERVKYWRDKSVRGNMAYAKTLARCPRLNAADTCNGLPVIDFGRFNDSDSGCFALARTIDSARAVYVVWGTQNGGGHLFGYPPSGWVEPEENSIGSSWLDFTRTKDPSSEPGGGVGAIMAHQSSAYTVASGTIFTNGIQTAFTAVPTGDYQLFEFHTGQPASVAGINIDRGEKPGGGRYGEIVVYDRSLSPRERIATRNHLLKKWFGKTDAELEALPAATAPELTMNISMEGGSLETAGATLGGDITFAEGSTWTISVDADGTVKNPLSLTGKLAFADGVSIAFDAPDLDAPVQGQTLELACAGGYDGVAALNAAQVSGIAFTRRTAPVFHLRQNGRLAVRFGLPGMGIIFK